MEYTVGLIFTPELDHVLMINPNRPAWQVGFLNGVGGKFEEGETAAQCMVRELEEETDLKTNEDQWRYFGREEWSDGAVHFLVTRYEGSMDDAQTMTDEKVEWIPTADMPDRILPNMRWLVPLAIDILERNALEEVIMKNPK